MLYAWLWCLFKLGQFLCDASVKNKICFHNKLKMYQNGKPVFVLGSDPDPVPAWGWGAYNAPPDPLVAIGVHL